MRKLVTIRKIDEIHPIPNADLIEVAKIGGWNKKLSSEHSTENSISKQFLIVSC